MSGEAKVLIGIGLATLIILFGGVFLLNKSNPSAVDTQTQKADPKVLIRDDSNKITADNAKVTLVEFGDFQCPACGAAQPIVKQILNEDKGAINFVFRNFPLPMHQNAQIAAEAAEAAGEQSKYWEMHDKLYETQNQWGGEKPLSNKDALTMFVSFAKELGLDTEKFKQAVESSKFQGKIQKDQQDGNSLGVNATPTFFINNKQYSGSFNDLKIAIDAAMKSI